MTILNLSFNLEPKDAVKFCFWVRKHGVSLVRSAAPLPLAVSLLELKEVPGDPEFTSGTGAMFSLQLEFDDEAKARSWFDCGLPELVRAYSDHFGADPLLFPTVLRKREILHTDGD